MASERRFRRRCSEFSRMVARWRNRSSPPSQFSSPQVRDRESHGGRCTKFDLIGPITCPQGVASRPFDLAMSDFFHSSDPTGVGSTSSSLLERVKLQDGAAWQRLVQLYAPLIYHWARHNKVPAADASDIVQEVLRSVVGKVASFRRDRPGDSFRGWLYTITVNKVRDFWRKLPACDSGI